MSCSLARLLDLPYTSRPITETTTTTTAMDVTYNVRKAGARAFSEASRMLQRAASGSARGRVVTIDTTLPGGTCPVTGLEV